MSDRSSENDSLNVSNSPSAYLQSHDVEAVGRMLNALLTEHWIICDRVAVMERLLTERGVLAAGQVDTYVPSGDFAVTLQALRDTVFAKVLQAPFAGDSRTVENLKARNP